MARFPLSLSLVVPVLAAIGLCAQDGPKKEWKFEPLVQVNMVEGPCEVKKPKDDAFELAINEKAYPMGSIFRTPANATCVLTFSFDDSVALAPDTEVMAGTSDKYPQGRLVRLIKGTIRPTLRDDLPLGYFQAELPDLTCTGMGGKSEISIADSGTAERTTQIRTITGRIRAEGLHYTIPLMRAANITQIIGTTDHGFTRVASLAGDYSVELPNGTEIPSIFQLSPKGFVKLWRKHAEEGGRLLVTVLAVSPSGKARNNFTYALGRDCVATGELVEQEKISGDTVTLSMTTMTDFNPDAAPQAQPVPADQPAETVPASDEIAPAVDTPSF